MINASQGRLDGLLGHAGEVEDGLATAEAPGTGRVGAVFGQWLAQDPAASRQLVVGTIILLALVAFELFNFDTTRFALQNLLGEVEFLAVPWATILAVAFCGIDFAGLARLFRPVRVGDEPAEAWYLMGAWFLAATMNAVMTWWAVSVQLASGNTHLGNEVLNREQLLHYVPLFVAVLVWLTRVLIIGAVTMAANRVVQQSHRGSAATREDVRILHLGSVPADSPRQSQESGSNLRSDVDAAMRSARNGGFGAAARPRPATTVGRPTLGGTTGTLRSTPSSRTTAPMGRMSRQDDSDF